MKKSRRNAGFTMAELLIVVAVLGILMGIAAMNIAAYQRRLKRKEADSAAREIFVAAQNHLTAADAMGQLENYSGALGSQIGTSAEYLIAYPQFSGASIRDLMLPFGAIDETIRGGGSYIIHYNKDRATVLDVFYSDSGDSHYGVVLETGDYEALTNADNGYTGDNKMKERQSATVGESTNRVIGWYGGANVGSYEDYLAEPTISVSNGDTLVVTVSALAAKTGNSLENTSSMSLIVTGETSGAMKVIELEVGGDIRQIKEDAVRKKLLQDETAPASPCVGYQVTLDKITVAGGRFADTMLKGNLGGSTGVFQPGENLKIRAVAFDNGTLSNIAESGTVVVNSLFSTRQGDNITLSSFRHLENLDSGVSGVSWTNPISVTQKTDLDWTKFMTNGADVSVYYKPEGGTSYQLTDPGYYYPVTVASKFSYDGGSHQIKNLTMTGTQAGLGLFTQLSSGDQVEHLGLFTQLSSEDQVEHLDLVNFKVKGTGTDAGALAGSAVGAYVTDVKAYNDIAGLGNTVKNDKDYEISGTGSVGGLIGSLNGGTVDQCAAALYVKSTGGSAGGLIGTVSAGEVKNSYAGGHTVDGTYKVNSTDVQNGTNVIGYTYTAESRPDEAGRLNVMGATAGGLIGSLSGGAVSNCYTTCSAGGTTAGGFVGSVTGGSTDANCYCTGLVAYWSVSGSSYKALEKPTPTDTSVSLGVFAGSSTVDLYGRYLDIVNYFSTKITGQGGNKKAEQAEQTDQIAKVGTGSSAHVIAFDNDTSEGKPAAENYDRFVRPYGGPSVTGVPYDPTVFEKSEKVLNASNETTGVRFSLHGLVEKSGENVVFQQETHYGDWPIYETYVVNN